VAERERQSSRFDQSVEKAEPDDGEDLPQLHQLGFLDAETSNPHRTVSSLTLLRGVWP
jgi:hypothetical protein